MTKTALFCAVLTLACSVQAATVTTTADSGNGSLRAAIAAAVPGETINFTVSGTITLTTGELLVNKNLTVSGPGAANLTIERSAASGTADFRLFNIDSGIVTLSGLTIRNGRADEGACGVDVFGHYEGKISEWSAAGVEPPRVPNFQGRYRTGRAG